MPGLTEFFRTHPKVQIVIFAGKGGLGKTTCSASLAHSLAAQGKKVLCFSTDPQASLSDIFEEDLFGKGEVEVAKNLFVTEIDADKRVKEYQESVKKKILEMYKMDELPPEIESYIDSTSAEPAMYESATYDAMAQFLATREYDLYIFDMPPFGHGVRMIAMAGILSKWVEKITEAREKAKEYEEIAATLRGGKVSEDHVLEELMDIKKSLTNFTDIMLDKERTGFFMVMTPERMAILDTARALSMFRDLGLRLSGIVLNQVLPPNLDTKSGFLAPRMATQREHLEKIRQDFGDQVVSVIPMFPKEPKGMEGLAKVSDYLVSGRMGL
jgi:arsenite/tail-anchored protein-transporting ATPase